MSQWMTSGASRLKAKQNRSFASRAQQRAVASGISLTRSTAGVPGQRQASTRRRIAVGETVSSCSKAVYRTAATAQVNQYGHPHQSMAHPFADEGNPTFNGNSGQRRRIRDSSSSLHLEVFSRDQVLNRARRGFGLLSPSVSRNMSHLPYHSLAPRMSNDNPFDAALQAIDDVRIRSVMSTSSPRPQLNERYQMKSPRYEQLNPFIQSPQNRPPLSFASLAARLSAASPSSKQMTDWDPWSIDVHQRHTSRRQGLKLPPRSGTRVTEAEGFSFNLPYVVKKDLVVHPTSNLIDALRSASENFLSREPHPLRPLKRRSDSTDSSVSSTGSRKQPRQDGFGLSDDRNADRFPSFFLDDIVGEQERMGGMARFKTRRVEETALLYPPSCDLAGQIALVTTLPSQRKTWSVIDDAGASGNFLSREPHPSRSWKRGSDSTDSSVLSTGSRKQPRLDGIGLNDDRNADRFPSFFLDVSAGELERMGGMARFKTRHAEETALVYPPSRDLAGQVAHVTTLPSQRRTSSVINDGRSGQRVEPLRPLDKRGRQVPALRFFNNGIEVNISGRRIVDPKEASETKGEASCKNVDKPIIFRRTNKIVAPSCSEEVLETEGLADLQEHQKSIWNQVTVDHEETKSRRKSNKSKARVRKASTSPLSPGEARWEVDPTPSELSSNPNKLASAGVDDMIGESLKEREKVFGAASVLVEFSRGPGDSENGAGDCTKYD